MYNQEVKSWLKIIAMSQATTNLLMQITPRILRTLRTPRILRTLRTPRTPRTLRIPRILRTPRILRIPRILRRTPIQETKTEQRTAEQETHRMSLLPTAKTLLKTTHPQSTTINYN